jgi:hypothetical protein
MPLDKIIPFISSKGNKYLLKFEQFHYKFDNINIPIIDITLLQEDIANQNNTFKYLLRIADYVLEYINHNNVILYYYCDHKEIEKRVENISPQEYRFNLFSALFKRKAESNFIKKSIIISDSENGDHFISIISRIEDSINLDIITSEIEKLNNKP